MEENIIYLDHASTSYPVQYFAKEYYIPGNPNSPHALGLEANKYLGQARERIMKCLGVRSGKVLFCRCATEAVEWLTQSLVEKYEKEQRLSNSPRYHIHCSKYEHDSVFDYCGDVFSTINRLKDWMEPKEIYLHQYVNQLTGTVFPIESIGKQVQSTGAFFGSDFTAAIGHYPILDNLDSFCDAVWFSGHKFGCEPGIGAIWLSDRLFKYLEGSEDSRNNYGLLHGTPNVSAAVAMSYAMEHAVSNALSNWVNHRGLINQLIFDLWDKDIEAKIITDEHLMKTRSINAIYLPNINADALVQYLSTKSIYISPGHSACADNDDYRVLETFNLTKEQASQTVRISFGEDTNMEDIDALLNGIMEFKEMFV